jgi:diguanylate cyclase
MRSKGFKYFINWFRPRGWNTVLFLSFNTILILLITLFVYQQSGTSRVYPHLMYIPIILSAVFFKFPGGTITAVICGLIMGPFMPLYALTKELQSTANWIIRSAMYISVGGFAGLAFTVIDKNIQKIEWQVLHGVLTDLPNRFFLSNEIQNIKKKMGGRARIAVFAFEVTNYQDINMTLGYENADKLMSLLAKKLESLPWDTQICELGSYLLGAAILVAEDQQIKNRITELAQLSSTSITIEEIPIFVIMKIGIDLQDLNSEDENESIMKAVSAAHRAYVENQAFQYYVDGMRYQSRETITLLGGVPKAIAEDEFVLFYQPIIDLLTNEVLGLEALIRWFHQERGLISPCEFIPLLEVTPLVNAVQDWVIKSAINDTNKFSEGDAGLNISINIATPGLKQFIDDSYLENILSNASFAPENVIFEMTESVSMVNTEIALDILHRMKKQGVKIALDDFGTGYSSLSYLKSMPIDIIKIDRQFIADALVSKESQEIIHATIVIAKLMDVKVLAEGVETLETYNWVKSIGCDYMQGFYKAKPMPFEILVDWLKDY